MVPGFKEQGMDSIAYHKLAKRRSDFRWLVQNGLDLLP